ncbi:MAG: hypothetical protein MUF27_17130 [Acidobacteria bacterium]|jgi:hypothetical protein|nr:hypothetical protein [Acidobacteriota bacterium]
MPMRRRTTGALLLGLVLLFGFHSMLVSHRSAGPLRAVQAALDERLAAFRTGPATPPQGQAAGSALERDAPLPSLP